MQKKYQAKIYSLAGAYIKTINPKQIMNEVRFSSKIGGGQGQCILELNLPIDDFGEGVSIGHMRVVKIYEMDDTFNSSPLLIFTGFVSQYIPFFNDGTEGVRLILLGLVSLLSFAYYKNGSNFTITESAKDPAAIMRNVIDHFNTIYGGAWLSHGANCVDVGTNVTYEFKDQKWFDAIKKAYDLAGGGRFWTIRENGQLYFKAKPASPTHIFTIGKDIESGQIPKNNEPVVNKFQLRWNTSLANTNDYSDAASITEFGTRENVDNDERITLITTADQRGNGEIADAKGEKIQAKLRINSKYNIESIHPGDTCSIQNIKKGCTVFGTNKIISSVSYDPEGVSIDLENDLPSFADTFNAALENNNQ